MTSSVAWLDHDDSQRKAMLEVVDLFREKGTVDDLGYGVIRDAFSNTFFPGVSVLHTRPRYILFIGWLYAGLLSEKVSGDQAIARGRERELNFAPALMASGETEGVIGSVAGRALKRLPSAAYWASIRTYGLMRLGMGLEAYCRSLPALRRAEVPAGDALDARHELWHLPEVPNSFLEGRLAFDFEGAEADFLYERIIGVTGSTYLSWLLDQPLAEPCAFPWEHPAASAAPVRVQDGLRMAEFFAESQRGPSLLYNQLVAQAADRPSLADEYRDQLEEWATDIDSQFGNQPVNLSEFWALIGDAAGSVSASTRVFVDWTLSLTQSERHRLSSDVSAHERLALRERQLKGAMARLSSKRSLDTWSGSSGLQAMDYRWSSVQPMVRDIVNGRTDA